jgi:hypothetical protein
LHFLPTRYKTWCCLARSGVTSKQVVTRVCFCDQLWTPLWSTYCFWYWCVDPNVVKMRGIFVGILYWNPRQTSKGKKSVEYGVALL